MTEISQELARTDEDEAAAIIADYLQIEPHLVPRTGPAFTMILAAIRRGKAIGRQENLGGGGI